MATPPLAPGFHINPETGEIERDYIFSIKEDWESFLVVGAGLLFAFYLFRSDPLGWDK